MRSLLLWLLLLLALAACAAPGGGAEPITLKIPVPVDQFSPTTDLTIMVWNEEQLALSEKSNDCSVSFDVQSGQEQVHCPPGVTYQPPQPEIITVAIAQVKDELSLTVTSLTPGETFKVSIRGRSSDECNTSAAQFEGKARRGEMTLDSLLWATTAMACITPEPAP